MSYTILSSPMNTGVRRLSTLGAMWGLGSALDVAQAMIADGYNQIQINNLVAGGATEAQIQNLWDNYGPGTPEFGLAVVQLQNSLTPPGSFIDTSLPQWGADAVNRMLSAGNAVIQTAYGVRDFAAQETWDWAAGKFTETQQALNAVTRQAPRDPQVVQMVSEFNSMVAGFADKYNQIVGHAPANVPLASIPTLGILPALPLAYLAAAAVVVVGILGTLYELNQRIVAKAQLLQAQNAGSVINNPNLTPAEKAGLLSALGPSAPTDWNTWFKQNMGLVIIGLIGIVVLPQLLKKI